MRVCGLPGDCCFESSSSLMPFSTSPDSTSARPSAICAIKDCLDPQHVTFYEEFLPGSTVALGIGALNWNVRSIGAAPIISNQAGIAPNLGIGRVTTTSTSTQGGNLALDNALQQL